MNESFESKEIINNYTIKWPDDNNRKLNENNTFLTNKTMEKIKDDSQWVEYLENKLTDIDLSEKEKAYYKRIIRVHNMLDLSLVKWHPINLIINSIVNSKFFEWFDHANTPEIVSELETFDLFNFSDDHIARRPSDSYFIHKSEDKEHSMLLRPHTSVMWYHYLLEQGGKEKLYEQWDVQALSWWKVYRVDELDKTHHECFHQIDGLRITDKNKKIINQDTLKEVLSSAIKALFWENVEYRFNVDQFPYTVDSLEVEVMYKWKWLEVLWAWVVHPNVLTKLWLDPEKYNWWAFGFWIERLAMALKSVPDIRIFWSEDKRILKQWGNMNPYKEVSNYPPVYKDISFITPKNLFLRDEKEEEKSWELELVKETESNFFALTWVIRDIGGDLIEEVKIIDMYENDKKFWEENKSVTIKIVFRSIERTLTDEEINKMYFEIRWKIEESLWYELR
jgi:phenylalanyl-tRNA synthetase alpha chain